MHSPQYESESHLGISPYKGTPPPLEQCSSILYCNLIYLYNVGPIMFYNVFYNVYYHEYRKQTNNVYIQTTITNCSSNQSKS